LITALFRGVMLHRATDPPGPCCPIRKRSGIWFVGIPSMFRRGGLSVEPTPPYPMLIFPVSGRCSWRTFYLDCVLRRDKWIMDVSKMGWFWNHDPAYSEWSASVDGASGSGAVVRPAKGEPKMEGPSFITVPRVLIWMISSCNVNSMHIRNVTIRKYSRT